MRARGVYVCGTDTGIGKTHVAIAIVRALRRRGLRVAVMKPVASGCTAGRNADADRLIAACGLDPDYALVNPYAFERPIAPHLAAASEGRTIDAETVLMAFGALARQADLVVVEGVGGVAVPLSATALQSDLMARMGLPAVLVVGIRLGCLNHALLTASHLEACGVTVAGWIANLVDPTCEAGDANIAALVERLAAPLLGVVPHGECRDAVQSALADGLLRRIGPRPAAG